MPLVRSAPAALAETLLTNWEAHAQPVTTPAYRAARPAVLARLAAYSARLLHSDDINLDPEDARATLRRATTFGLSRAAAAGPNRATRLAALLAAALVAFPPVTPSTGLHPVAALLSLQSGCNDDLAMDELTEILATVQQTLLTPETKLAFGHGISPAPTDAGLLAWLLVAYTAG